MDKTERYGQWLEHLQRALEDGRVILDGEREHGQVVWLLDANKNRIPIARTIPDRIQLDVIGGELRVVDGKHNIRVAGKDLLTVLDPVSVDGMQRLRVFEARTERGHLAHFVAVPFLLASSFQCLLLENKPFQHIDSRPSVPQIRLITTPIKEGNMLNVDKSLFNIKTAGMTKTQIWDLYDRTQHEAYNCNYIKLKKERAALPDIQNAVAWRDKFQEAAHNYYFEWLDLLDRLARAVAEQLGATQVAGNAR